MKLMDWNNMRKKLEALFILDNALTDLSDDSLRLVHKNISKTEIRYTVDNGAGDSLDVIFTENTVLIKGFAHENILNQFASDEWNQSIIEQLYEGLDAELMELFTVDERNYSTFFIWYDGKVHQNLPDGNDGGRWLLGYAFDTYERFKEFAQDYYSIQFKDDLLKKLYENATLSDNELMELINAGM